MNCLGTPVVLAIAGASLLVVLGVGILAVFRTEDARDWFIAGQRAGLLATALATMSAAFSGFVFLGGPGLTWRLGAASLWIVLPVGITPWLLTRVLGGPLREMAGGGGIYTIPDVVARRWRHRPTTLLSILAVVLGSIGYLATQVLVLGLLGEALLGTGDLPGNAGLPFCMALGLLAVLAYGTLGGMLAGVWTDLVQGVIMVVTGVLVAGWAVAGAGGPGGIVRSILADGRFGPAFLHPLGRLGPAAAAGFFFLFSAGVLGQPHMVHKFFMLRDPRHLRRFPLVLGASQSLVLLVWVGVGFAVPALVARAAMAPPARCDDAMIAWLCHGAPPWLAGLAVAGALAAIMSTADSFLNVGAAALVRDLPRALGRPVADELAWGRWATFALGGGAWLLAWLHRDLVALLGTFAFGLFAAGLAPLLAVGLHREEVTPRWAAAAAGTGILLALALEALRKSPWRAGVPGIAAGVPPAAIALAASFLVVLLPVARAGGRVQRRDSR